MYIDTHIYVYTIPIPMTSSVELGAQHPACCVMANVWVFAHWHNVHSFCVWGNLQTASNRGEFRCGSMGGAHPGMLQSQDLYFCAELGVGTLGMKSTEQRTSNCAGCAETAQHEELSFPQTPQGCASSKHQAYSLKINETFQRLR